MCAPAATGRHVQLWQWQIQVTRARANYFVYTVLHDQLLAAQHHLQGGAPRPQGAPSHQQQLQPNTAASRDQANIDPAISGVLGGAPQTPPQRQQAAPEDTTPKSYSKRELSTSKRAAQNRAAQVGTRFPTFPDCHS